METLFNFEQLEAKQLNLNRGEIDLYIIRYYMELFPEITDEIISWLINPLPIYASMETEDIKNHMESRTKEYIAKRESSINLVGRIKQELYDYLCTNSKTYKKERTKMTGNINVLINGLATAIATNLGGIEIGIVTTIVTAFLMTVHKMGKRIACDYLKSPK